MPPRVARPSFGGSSGSHWPLVARCALKLLRVTPAWAIAIRSAGSCSIIRFRRFVLTITSEDGLSNKAVPPTVVTVQRLAFASFMISTISAVDDGTTDDTDGTDV